MIDEDEDDCEPCPVCRVDLEVRCIGHKSNDEVDWHKYQRYCTECGFKGDEWETVE